MITQFFLRFESSGCLFFKRASMPRHLAIVKLKFVHIFVIPWANPLITVIWWEFIDFTHFTKKNYFDFWTLWVLLFMRRHYFGILTRSVNQNINSPLKSLITPPQSLLSLISFILMKSLHFLRDCHFPL